MTFWTVLIASLWAAPLAAQATLISEYEWKSEAPEFGGLSGLEVASDGTTFIAVSDSGWTISGQFLRQDGNITGLRTQDPVELLDHKGASFRDTFNDSEGIAITPDGETIVSFEGEFPMIRRYRDIAGIGIMIPPHSDFAKFGKNAGPEALAIDQTGILYTLPERSGRRGRPFQVYRSTDESWEPAFQIARIGPFLPVGADVGPDGRFYLLERDFVGFGFRSRIRRFNLDGSNDEILLETEVGTHDNLEGIAVWRDDAGDLRMVLVSDDNFKWFQRTDILEYRLTD